MGQGNCFESKKDLGHGGSHRTLLVAIATFTVSAGCQFVNRGRTDENVDNASQSRTEDIADAPIKQTDQQPVKAADDYENVADFM